MYRYADVCLRKFTAEDIPNKIKWINDDRNNTYLHYDLPLEYEKTLLWYEKNKDNDTRFDAVIEYRGEPVGLTGLLSIDQKNKKAESYIIIGDFQYKLKGIAAKAGLLNILHGLQGYVLNKIYAFTEVENNPSLKLHRKMGYVVEGLLKKDLYKNGKFIDRYCLALFKENFKIPEDVYIVD